jgi:PAS domain S-box-containing protein
VGLEQTRVQTVATIIEVISTASPTQSDNLWLLDGTLHERLGAGLVADERTICSHDHHVTTLANQRDFLTDGGKMGALIRAHDWAALPLGAPETWPQALLSAVQICLNMPIVSAVHWGPDLFTFYNDAYVPNLSNRDPGALGRPMREVWADIWDVLGPQITSVVDTGRGFSIEDQLLKMKRNGRLEDTYWIYSFAPIYEAGAVAGIFVTALDTTDKVVAERRLTEVQEHQRQMLRQMPGFAGMLSGPDLVYTYVNEAYATVSERCEFVGRRFRDVFADVEGQGYFEAFENAFHSGKGVVIRGMELRLHGRDEKQYVDFVLEPIRDDTGVVTGLFVGGYETTEVYRGSEALRESEARQVFMLELSDALRPLETPVAIAAEAAARLGKWLGLNRVFYGEIVGTKMTVECNYTDGVKSLVGEHDMSAFGDFLLKYRADALIVSEDTQADKRYSEDAQAGLLDRQVVAFCDIGLFETGDCVSLMAAQSATTRQWTALEQGIVREVGGRVKLAIERARAEAALRESESRFRLMADAVPQIVWVTDGEGKAEFFNKHWFDYTGAEPEPTSADKVSADYIHPEDATTTRAAFNEAWRTGTAFLVEHRIRSHSGDYRWFLVRGEPRRGPGTSEVVRWFGASVDIHDRKLAEENLRELNGNLEELVAEALAERRIFAEIIESTDAAVLACGLDFGILAINAANVSQMERAYGVRPEAGDNLLDLISAMPEHRWQVERHWGRALAGEEFVIVEEFGHPDRERAHYEVRFGPLRDRNGERIGAFQTAYDVTTRVRAQAELTAAQEALRQGQKMEAMGQLTGGVAHDFNNLLTPIVGSLDMLQRKGIGGEREQRLIAGALQSADRAKTLVHRLLAFARRQPLQTTAVDVDALVTGIADLVASTSGPQIKIVVEGAKNLPPAEADANQLEMALLNLGVNARDAMPNGGTLRITVGSERIGTGHRSELGPGEYIHLSVADTGVGMDEPTLKRAVEPFFSTKGVGQGTGLGLSMVHGLASQLGGALTIDSRLGVGTNVELWLPVSEAPSAAARPPEAASLMAAAKGTVLLVDDEELVRLSTADMLGDMGYAVVEAGSAEAALQLLDGGLHPDLLVTDHSMPGMNGTDLARAIMSTHPAVQVLIVSGYAESEGVDVDLPRLNKPFRNADLVTMLSQFTSREQT